MEGNFNASNEEALLKERKDKVAAFIRAKQTWLYYIGLAVIVWFGAIFIRTANIVGLKDSTGGLNGYALAPDLDPYLFLRWAKEIVAKGSLSMVDSFRYVPLGYNTSEELPGVTYSIAYLHKFLSLFSPDIAVEYVAIILPVVFFALTLIAFFFMVKKLFEDNKHSKMIALISTAFLAVFPGFVHRTLAGVPEKESIAFLFLFLAVYFMASAWKAKDWKGASLLGLAAGISTGLMGLSWGGITFLFVIVSLSAFVYFFTKNFEGKSILAYAGWIIGFTPILYTHQKYGSLLTSTTSGFSYFVLGLMVLNYALFNTRLKERLKLERIRTPDKFKTLAILIVLGLLAILIIDPAMISREYQGVSSQLLKPFEGDRFTVTVAENNRPFLNTWRGEFGWIFWIFILGSLFLIFEYALSLSNLNRIILTSAYAVLVFGLAFTRIKPESILNGSHPLSIALFIGSILLFAASLVYLCFREDNLEFSNGAILALTWIFFALLSVRGAVRLLYFLYPIVAIISGYVVVRLSQKFFESTSETKRFVYAAFAAVVAIMLISQFYSLSVSAHNQASASVPSSYNVQWQKAMSWVRGNTPSDAVFAHWWDYGYWVQTIGERPTVLDGGNAIVYWDYLMGRAITSPNEIEALEFYYSHNVSYLLLDSSDIGKYQAFSSIGSDENYDRYSWISTFRVDPRNMQEKRDETIYLLTGGTAFDEEVVWKNRVFKQGSAGIGGFMLPIKRINGSQTGTFGQPTAIIVDKGEQISVPISCIYIDNSRVDFGGEGIDGCLYLIPEATVINGNRLQLNSIGGGLWLSPRLMRSEFTKLYILQESTNFELVHLEKQPISEAYGLPNFVFFQGQLLGPIKIWKVNYPGDIKFIPEYLNTSYPADRPGLSEIRR